MSFADDMENRLRKFANGAIAFCRTLPCTDEAREWGSQLRRASTGASANYRATRRAKSKADWLSNVSDALEELDEADGWFQTICENDVAVPSQELRTECQELRAILAKSVATARRNQRRDRENKSRRRRPDSTQDPQR
jgi:four helix bundle protein